MISVVILGSGNVATHLINVFLKVDSICLKQVYARNLNDFGILKKNILSTNNLALLEKADITIIAVSDDAIAPLSSMIKNSFVVHTSGSLDMNALKNKGRKGVFYPLQSFSKEKKIDFKSIPFCIEAENKDDLSKLKILASLLKAQAYFLNSKQRKKIHIAAVFVNNFTNHMYTIAYGICKEHDIPFNILHPLIIETSNKIKNLAPKDAQTGPAKRNDKETIQNHLNLLTDAQQEIYLKITQSIQEYGKKL